MKKFTGIDIGLLQKYDKPGPRYTSYPPAPAFSSDFTETDFRQTILANNSAEVAPELSLYFHIPFCDTLCYFCGCNMLITNDRANISRYVGYLKKEIDMVAEMLAPHRRVCQMHWGGGTPSYLEPDEIRELGGYINAKFPSTADRETSVEIDPRGLTEEHIRAFRDVGFNRLSMGVQDFTEKVQIAVNRVQPYEMTAETLSWARAHGFGSVNLDLIYGLPHQTLESFSKTLDLIIGLNPERLAVFNFAYVPWLKKHMSIIKKEDLPTGEAKLEILKMTIERLTEAGYEYIGMDHFAKPDDELAVAQREKTLYRNFQGYSTNSGSDLYALGMSSISQFHNVYAQNFKTLKEYYDAIGNGKFATTVGYRMSQDDIIRQHVIMRLMCDLELNKTAVENIFGINFDKYFADSLVKLQEFIDEGLVEINGNLIVISGMGRLLLRNIAMCFDAYLDKMMKDRPVFSRTV